MTGDGLPALDRAAFLTALAAQERQGVALWWVLTAVRTDLGCDLRTVTLTTAPRTMLSTIENLLARASEHPPLRILVQPVEVAMLADAALIVVTTLPRERLLVPSVGPLPGNAPVAPISPADWAILEQALIAHRTCVAWGHHRPSARTRAARTAHRPARTIQRVPTECRDDAERR